MIRHWPIFFGNCQQRCQHRIGLVGELVAVEECAGRREVRLPPHLEVIVVARHTDFFQRSAPVRLGRATRTLIRKYRIRRATLTLTQTVRGITKTTKTSVPVRL